jgi:hypothetical protein
MDDVRGMIREGTIQFIEESQVLSGPRRAASAEKQVVFMANVRGETGSAE